MSRLASTFAALRARGERALVPFVTFGDPSPIESFELACAYIDAGADVLEIGIPFTDPLADGPTIQRASERALAAGATLGGALETISRLRERFPETPLVPMTYINPVWQIGFDDFARRAAASGVDAMIISDLPPEEGAPWSRAAGEAGLDTVYLLAPTSDAARVERVARATTGFVYAVARLGVTGARTDVPTEVADLCAALRAVSDVPVCAGFGFSDADQIRATLAGAPQLDGIVVASALIDRLENAPGTPRERRQAATNLVQQLKAATR